MFIFILWMGQGMGTEHTQNQTNRFLMIRLTLNLFHYFSHAPVADQKKTNLFMSDEDCSSYYYQLEWKSEVRTACALFWILHSILFANWPFTIVALVVCILHIKLTSIYTQRMFFEIYPGFWKCRHICLVLFLSAFSNRIGV